MSDYEQSVFISYAWGGEREDIVNEIDETLQQRGIRIVRDKRALGYRGSIRDFMERIGRGSCVIVVISDKYLRSPNCMFELVEIAENKQFYDRVFPVVLSDANIYDPIKRIEYVKHWEAKRKELAKAMKTLDPANLQGIRDDMDQYDRIRDKISGITSILKDMNTLTPEMHRDSEFSNLYDAIVERLKENATDVTAEFNEIAKNADREAKAEAERLATQKAEEERLAKAEAEADRKAKAEADLLATQKAERERIEREKAEQERLAFARAEAERQAKEETARLAAQKAEEERVAKAKAEAERLAEQKAGEERLAQAKADREAKAEAERKAKDEAARIVAQKAEADRQAKEEAARLTALKAEEERVARAKAEAERLAQQKAEEERLAQAKADREAKAEAERLAKQKAEQERLAKENLQAAAQLPKPVSVAQKTEATRAPSGKKSRLPLLFGAIGVVAVVGVVIVAALSTFNGIIPNTGSPPDSASTDTVAGASLNNEPSPEALVAPTPTRARPNPTAQPTQPPSDSLGMVLNTSEAEKIIENDEAQSISTIAREQYTDDEWNSFIDNAQPIPVTLTNPGPIFRSQGWCATTREILEDNLASIKITFKFDNKVVPESKLLEQYWTDDNGWECFSKYIVIDNWITGEYAIHSELSITQAINDGLDDYEPFTSERDFIVTVENTSTGASPTEAATSEFFTTTFSENTDLNIFEFFEIGDGDERKLDVTQSGDGLLFTLNDEDLYAYYIYEPQTYEDVVVRVVAENTGMINKNNVSLVCRRNGDRWYEFSVTSGGLWDLYDYNDGYTSIANGGAPSLKTGQHINDYEMRCIGNNISLYINGEEVITVETDLYTKGQVGFNISSLSVYPIEVRVAEFEISEP